MQRLYILALYCWCYSYTWGREVPSVGCNKEQFRLSLSQLADDVLLSLENSSSTCRHIGAKAVTENLHQCERQFTHVFTDVIRQFIGVLDTVNNKSCLIDDSNQGFETCSTSKSELCIRYFYKILGDGNLAAICRQSSLTLACVQSEIEACSGFPRYMLASIVDEIHFTSDLVCESRSCRTDIASKCLSDAMATLDFPLAIAMSSKMVCSKVKASLTCISNHTDMCASDNIPLMLADGFFQLLQFTSTYCTGTADDIWRSDVLSDLVQPLYLATIATNRWTPQDDICRTFKSSLITLAQESFKMTTISTHWFPWQQTVELLLTKYSLTCFQDQSVTCDWLFKAANGIPQCDLDLAVDCVDMATLSKLVLEVNVGRSNWEAVCQFGYNMLACAQYYTGACFNLDLSPVFTLTQEVESLVGYECSNVASVTSMATMPSNDTCEVHRGMCDFVLAIDMCFLVWTGAEDICLLEEDMYACVHDYTEGCNSVGSVPLQFFFEWLLSNCTQNMTLAREDSFIGVNKCKMQYGYNLNNGFQTHSDFKTMFCTASSLYQQCLSSLMLSETITIYGQSLDMLLLTVCNSNMTGGAMSFVQEPESCPLSSLAGEIALIVEMFTNLPFSSLKQIDTVCHSYSYFPLKWQADVGTCSQLRQRLVADAISVLDSMSELYCSHTDGQCDVAMVTRCLEEFGTFSYFADGKADVCGKMTETFECVLEHSIGCDSSTHDALLLEVRAIHSMMGNITCPRMQWCGTGNSSDWFPWQVEMCTDWDQCLMFDWMKCVSEYGLYFSCVNYTDGVTCIEQSLVSCDPLQVLQAKSEMLLWIQLNGAVCNFVPMADSPGLTPVHTAIYNCAYNSISYDVTKQGMCNSIGQYLSCIESIDQSEVLMVWRGILGSNALLWQKHVYLDCQLSSTGEFIVSTDFDKTAYVEGTCASTSAQQCLRTYMELVVTSSHLFTLTDRPSLVCQREEFLRECVLRDAAGCTNELERTMLTSAQWLHEAFDNVGTCTNDTRVSRECRPDEAMDCVTELGQMLKMNYKDANPICLKLPVTANCVYYKTSGCDFYTRSELADTFNKVSSIVKNICTVSPPTTSDSACLREGEVMQCDLEEALMCMVPVQAAILQLQFNTTVDSVCRAIPEMKACLRRTTSSCDDVTLGIVGNRVNRLAVRLGDQCPELYCDECAAQMCLSTLQKQLQYDSVSYCSAVREARQCIEDYSHHCVAGVQETFQQQVALVAGSDAYVCDITLTACLENFMTTALQISSYSSPMYNVSLATDYMLVQMCTEAGANFFCVSQHLASMDGQQLEIMNSTLHRMGEIVTYKCQGPSLECYNCVNASSNEECNQQQPQKCPLDMQMCGTYVRDSTLSKGCVSPDMCEMGCTGEACSLCCGSYLCNQPWNNVLLEPSTCQPQNAMWCAYRLMSTLAQNETLDCSVLEESASCILESTRDCTSPQSLSLSALAQQLLTSDAVSSCVADRSVCGCGQCSSYILLSVVATPTYDLGSYCRSVYKLYNRSLQEMNITSCDLMTLQNTVYNLNMAAHIIQGLCPLNTTDSPSCHYNGLTYSEGSVFMSTDGCNQCFCDMGRVGCTYMMCPTRNDTAGQCPRIGQGEIGTCVEQCSTHHDCAGSQICCSNGCGHVCREPIDETTCYYGNRVYSSGEGFSSVDGCNTCRCNGGAVACTLMYCPPPDGNQCDFDGIQTCMRTAALGDMVTMATPSTYQHVCMSAVGMLRCILPKLTTCSQGDIQIVQDSVFWMLNTVAPLCDVNAMIWNYFNLDWIGNFTLPKPDDSCSLENVAKCFEKAAGSTDCSTSQGLVDCIYNSTSSCVSVDMVPVLYQLEHHLETYSCDIRLPWQHRDPLMPVARCMNNFADSLGKEVTWFLLTNQMSGLCENVPALVTCLGNISDSQGARAIVVHEAVHAVSNLVHRCDLWYSGHPTDLLECHQCEGFTDMEACNAVPAATCQPNQVCATMLHLDVYSGKPVISKGCASQFMCSQGCDPVYMSCVSCCHGNMCNSALNMTHITMPTTTPWQPTRTTPRPTTDAPTPATCDLDELSVFVTTHILSLMNFNSAPIVNRQYFCMNYETDMATILDNLDPECTSEVTEHVQTVVDWLLSWTRQTCNTAIAEEKCWEAVYCVENIQQFDNKADACRNLTQSMTCLQSYFSDCSAQNQVAINRTVQLLSDIEYTVCEPNKLSSDKEAKCVDMTTSNISMATCNTMETEDCIAAIQKAMNNPFLSRTEFCGLFQQGMHCVHDNTYNCSTEFLNNVAPIVMDMIQHTASICSETFCPLSTQCKLETAKQCILTLENEIARAVETGNWSQHVCLQLSQTHHCLMNATDGCYLQDKERLVHHFMTLALYAAPNCQQTPSKDHQQCVDTFLSGIDIVLNFDKGFIEHVLVSALLHESVSHRFSKIIKELFKETSADENKEDMNLNGINLPGGFMNNAFEDSSAENNGMKILQMFLQDLGFDMDVTNVSTFYNCLFGDSHEVLNKSLCENLYGLNLPGGYGINLPGGYGINLPGGYGINLPGGYGINLPGGYGGLNLPGGYGGLNLPGGYGINLPGGYAGVEMNIPGLKFIETILRNVLDQYIYLTLSNSTAADSLKDVKTFLTYYYGEETLSFLLKALSEYPQHASNESDSNTNSDTFTRQLLKKLNTTLQNVHGYIDNTATSDYVRVKSEVCSHVHESFHCLYTDLHQRSLSRKQELLGDASLVLLSDLAQDLCQVAQCHQCVGVHTNEECNMQPIRTCGPAQMCQSWMYEDRVYKGCRSVVTCEEECSTHEGPCYCCHGYHCNTQAVIGKDSKKCDIDNSVIAAQDILQIAVNGSQLHNMSLLYEKATLMRNSVQYCYTDTHRRIYTQGHRLVQYLESENCTDLYRSNHCGLDSLVTLTSMTWSPFVSMETVDTICSLLNTTVHDLVLKMSSGACCSDNTFSTIMEIYQHMVPYCKQITLKPLCKPDLLDVCSKMHTENLDRNITGNRRGSDIMYTGSDVINFCSTFKNESDWLKDTVVAGCQVTVALDKCLSDWVGTTLNDCNLYTATRESCLSTYTSGCTPNQMSVIEYTLNHVFPTCTGQLTNTSEAGRETGSIQACVPGIMALDELLATSNNTHTQQCTWVDEVLDCLQSTQEMTMPDHYGKYHVGNKLEKLKTDLCTREWRFCNTDHLGTTLVVESYATTLLKTPTRCAYIVEDVPGEDVQYNDSLCDVETLLWRSSAYLHLYLTLHVLPLTEQQIICKYPMELANILEAVRSCPSVQQETLHSLMSWLQEEMKVMCTGNLVTHMCDQPVCDVVTATRVYEELSYFLSTASFDDTVLCRKLETVISRVECLSLNCTEEELNPMIDSWKYIRGVVSGRCPHVTDRFCDLWLVGQEKEADMTVTRMDIGCNTIGAEMCMFDTQLPAVDDPFYCSKMLTAVRQLKECVRPKIADCDHSSRTGVITFYTEMFSHGRTLCYRNFTEELLKGSNSDKCMVPMCSYSEAAMCIQKLTANQNESCGNINDVHQCLTLTIEGCHDIQKYILFSQLTTVARQHKLPWRCLNDLVAMETSENVIPVRDCVANFTEGVSFMMKNGTNATVCDLVTSMLSCLKMALTSDDLPGVMGKSLMHLVTVATPAIEFVCQDKEQEDDIIYEPAHESASCDIETAVMCLSSYTTTTLLSAALTQDGKQFVCAHLTEGQECMSRSLQGCSTQRSRSLYGVMAIMEALGQLTGTCSPQPFTCQPDMATECVGRLAHVVLRSQSQTPHDNTVCSAVWQTKLCLTQTTSRCDRFTQEAILQMYEPIRCKAYSLCPMAIENPIVMETLPSCISPQVVSAHSDAVTCMPSHALYCLQDVYSYNANILHQDRNSACMSYTAGLRCFFNSIAGCEEDTVVRIAMFNLLRITQVFESFCPTKLKLLCDTDERVSGCDLDTIEDCMGRLHSVSGEISDRCMAKREATHCIEKSSHGCPHLVKTLLNMKLQTLLADRSFNDLDCHTLNTCTHNYVTLFERSLEQLLTFNDKMNGDLHSSMDTDKKDQGEFKSTNRNEDSTRSTNQIADSNQVVHSDQSQYRSDELDCVQSSYKFMCQARQESKMCIQSSMDQLPPDVAMVTKSVLSSLDDLFINVCSVLYGLRSEMKACNNSCIQCLVDHSQLSLHLTMLVSFLNDTTQGPMSSVQFCSYYDDWSMQTNTSSYRCMAETPEQTQLVSDLHDLYTKYCTLPCNTTVAMTCLNQLQDDILMNKPKEDICKSYFEAVSCVEESTMLCDFNTSRTLMNSVTQLLTNTGLSCYTLPTFEVTPTMGDITTLEGEGQEVTVTMTTSFANQCRTEACQIVITMVMNNSSTCPTSDDTGDMCCPLSDTSTHLYTSSCSLVFTPAAMATTQTFYVYPRIDYKVTPEQDVMMTLVASLFEGGVMETSDAIATVAMEMVDRDTAGLCMVILEPLITTFDNQKYYNLNQGEFVLYEHTDRQEKVHVAFQRCRNAGRITSCLCAVMVQVEDDVFVLDSCRRVGEVTHPLEFRVYQNGDLSSELQIYSSNQKQVFQFVLPSKALVNVRSVRSTLDVWIKPSTLDYNKTSGLCGKFDGDSKNDFMLPSGVAMETKGVARWGRRLVNTGFVNAWRAEDTLFRGIGEDQTLQEYSSRTCQCNGTACHPSKMIELCHMLYGEEITNQLGPYIEESVGNNRRKRETTDDWATIEYDSGTPDNVLPTWPTVSGYSEADAQQLCENTMATSALWDICSVAINMTETFETCVLNILLTDSTSLVNVSVEEMKLECKLAVLADTARVASSLNTDPDDLVTLLLTLTCINSCSGQGQCIDDVCECNVGYYGDDCSVAMDTVPIVSSLSEELYSMTTGDTTSPISRQITVYGEDFINTASLMCHFAEIEIANSGFNKSGISSLSAATFLTQDSIQCMLSGSMPFTGYTVAVSNNGVDQSTELYYVMQDPVCYDCIPSQQICYIQATSCVLAGQCYAAGAYNPTDDCYICDPITNVWRYKPSSTCLTTTTSTTSTTSTSTTSTTTTSPVTSTVSTSATSSTTSTPSTSTATSTSSSTTSTSTTPATTKPGQEGETDEQDGNLDSQAFTGIMVAGGSVGVIIIVIVACFAYRLRRSDTRKRLAQDSAGRSEPGPSLIAGIRSPPVKSAPFNPKNLGGPLNAPDVYSSDEGVYQVNIAMFESPEPPGASAIEGPGREYSIPRPIVDTVPAEIHHYDNAGGEQGRVGASSRERQPDYDNVRPTTGAPKRAHTEQDSPRPDYAISDDSSSSTTHL